MKRLSALKVMIIGLGQIGGSIGLDLVQRKIVAEVIGYDIDPAVVRKARRLNIIHRSVSSIQRGLSEADIIILAAPIRSIIKLIPMVCTGKNTDAVVMDLAGTKTEILKAVAEVMPSGNYISGHPLAGNEETGLAGAEKDKFQKAAFLLVPHRGTSIDWLERITQLIRKLGARPIIMKAEEHDRLIALTSHLPYALALGLMNLAGKKGMKNKHFRDLVGGSFRGATRVAQSPPDLTLDMFLTNKSNVTSAIDGLVDELKTLKKYVREGNDRELRKIINKSKVNRSKL